MSSSSSEEENDVQSHPSRRQTTTHSYLYGKPSYMSTEVYGLVLLAFSAMIYSGMSCCVKLATSSSSSSSSNDDDPLDSTEVVFIRALFQETLVVIAMMCYEIEEEEKEEEKFDTNDSSVSFPTSNDTEEDADKDQTAAAEEGPTTTHNNNTNTNMTAITTTTITTTATSSTRRRNNVMTMMMITRPFGRTRTIQRVVIARGAFGGLSFVFYYATISALPLGDAVALLSTRTIVTVLAAVSLLGEPLHITHILAAMFSVMGSICIARPAFLQAEAEIEVDNNNNTPSSSSSSSSYQLYGFITAFLGVVTGAGVHLLIRKAGKVGANTLELLFSWGFFALLFSSLIWLVDRGRDSWSFPTNYKTWMYLAGVCLFGSVAHFLLNFAGRIAPAGLTSIIRASDMLWAYVWQIIILHNVPTISTVTGVACIIISLILIAVQKIKDNNHHHALLELQKKKASSCVLDEMVAVVHDDHNIHGYGSTKHNNDDDNATTEKEETQPLVSG